MKHIFNKYIFPLITAFNSVEAVQLIAILFSPLATPLTAFLAIVVTFIAIAGWLTIFYEYSMSKVLNKKAKTNE